MTKTALITGISGQDGSYLADLLVAKGYNVVGLVRRSTNYRHPNLDHLLGKVTLEFGDLVDADCLNSIVQKHKPDEIYNIAAQSVPADSWNQPITTVEVTAVGVIRLLEAARRHTPHAKFYQATSREIFGAAPDEVCDEQTPLLANNPYGIAKLYAHQITGNYRESFDMFACGGILFNHESERRSLHFVTRKVTFAAACIKLGIDNPPLNEVGEKLVTDNKVSLGNLDAVRDWGYAPDYVEAMWSMLQLDSPQDFVIATNSTFTVRDLCEVAFDHVGLSWQDHVETDERFHRPTEIAASRGDYSLAEEVLGWKPSMRFGEMIRRMVDSDLSLLAS